jgi:hypothetical protein
MEYTETVRTTADPSRAWQAMAAVTSYPQWTESMTAVAGLDGPELAVGHRFRIRQPGFPAVVWRVTQVRDGETFTWESRSPGLHTVASHWLTTNDDGTTEITLRLRQTGALSAVMRLMTQAKTRRYMALEAAGLKAASES